MKKNLLGQTGISVSPIGLGTVKFGRNQGVKYPQGFDIPSDEHLISLLNIAKSLGINMIDTAPAYGTSEERLSTLLADQRDDWVIIGKVGEEFDDGQSSHNFTPDHFEYSLERSLKRLNTDYIDVLLIHSDGKDMDILNDDALIRKMHDFKDQGLVKAIGASTKTAQGGIKTLEIMDICMATYTSNYDDERPVLDYAEKHNKGIILKKSLSSGHNTNIEDAFKFIFNHNGTNATIVGTINPKHLKDNIETANMILNS